MLNALNLGSGVNLSDADLSGARIEECYLFGINLREANLRVVEHSLAWTARFRRLVRDYERLAQTLVGLHLVAFATLMLKRFVGLESA